MAPVIIVEGRDDTRRLKEVFPEIETLETNGSAITQATLEQIKRVHALKGAIVFTDPDYPGQRIRALIQAAVPTISHAFITREEAVRKENHKSLGVEHASDDAIRRALAAVYQPQKIKTSYEFTRNELLKYGLVGTAEASKKRAFVADALKLGYTNGKQLAKRLQLFGITKAELQAVLDQYERERDTDG